MLTHRGGAGKGREERVNSATRLRQTLCILNNQNIPSLAIDCSHYKNAMLGHDKLPNLMLNCVYLGKYDELE
jgi:hypothetical protein